MNSIIRNTLANFSYTSRRGLIKGMRTQGGVGFLPAWMLPRWRESAETKFLRGLDLDGKVVYDIGALHGHMTVFFASRARHVVTYEPNPDSFRRIEQNLRLNDIKNVTLRDAAVGASNGSLVFALDSHLPGRSSGDQATIEKMLAKRRKLINVPVTTLDDEIFSDRLPRPDLVKIDVEGMELAALRGMERTLRELKPAIYIEIHGSGRDRHLENARQLIGFLKTRGYKYFHELMRDDLPKWVYAPG